MRLLVVASADETVGRGRAMRCYAVAQAWMRLAPEAEVEWFGILKHRDVRGMVEAAGYRGETWAWDRRQQWVLLDDHDYAPEEWSAPQNTVAVFSDLGVRDLPCADLVINYAPYAHLLKYDCEALIGPRYTPIRDEIKEHGLPWVESCGAGLTALEHIYLGHDPDLQCLANDQVAQWLWLKHEKRPEIDGFGADRIAWKMLEMSGADET